MSLRCEQHRALRKSREFLLELLTMPADQMRAGRLRERARDCLRHFPFLTADGAPMFSDDGWASPTAPQLVMDRGEVREDRGHPVERQEGD